MELRRRERIITVPRNVVSDVRATFSFVPRRRQVARFLDGRERARCARSADAEQHRARERALRRGTASSKVSANPRGQRNERKIVAEQADESVRERDARHPVGAPAARIAAQHRVVADLVRAACRGRPAANSHASRSPTLNPCPATGCSVCAALPSATQRARAGSRANSSTSGNVRRSATRVKPPARAPKCAREPSEEIGIVESLAIPAPDRASPSRRARSRRARARAPSDRPA